MTAKTNNGRVRAFDLFCGGGGSSRGAAMAGAEPVGALDMWDVATDTYKLNFPNAKVYSMKASSLSPYRLMDEIGNIDLLLASPECTNHSVARGNKPECEQSKETAFEVIRFAKVLRPRWVIVENVLRMKRWDRFQEWHEKLKNIGYKTACGIIDAQFHRTAQSRRRLFIVGDLKTEPSLPKPGYRTSKTVLSILGRGEAKDKPWPFTRVNNENLAEATVERAARAIGSLGNQTPFIMVYYGTDGAGGFQTIDRPLRTVTTIDRFAYVRPNGYGHEMRMLQPPELAAAMGFPRSHRWSSSSSRRERIKLIGNAVCPRVLKDIVDVLVNKC